ncbi:MAG: DUF6850 family outer membrane beta-barrel protein [Dysgonomonas sp.]
MKNFRSILILLIVSINICAQDSISVIHRLQNNLSPVTNFSAGFSHNPASTVYTMQASMSDLSIGYEKQTGEGTLVQIGSEFESYAFRAESYAKIKNNHIWGKASYVNRNIDNIAWNESSDYLNIYPYVMADSVQSNNLRSEKYSFTGGYVQNPGRISWGIQLDYWALLEYRTKDPRPDNNTSNLVFTGGLNYKLNAAYAIGGGVLLRKYKQKNSLTFSDVVGEPMIYHLTGLGTDAYFFANGYPSVLYNGNGYGANIQLLSVQKQGISSEFAFENFSFDKTLNGNNSQKIEISTVDEDKYNFSISYLKKINGQDIGVKISSSYTDREGEENKFTQEGNNLIKITSETEYRNKTAIADMSFLYRNNSTNTTWSLIPYVSYLNMKETYKSLERSMQISRLAFGIKPAFTQPVKKHLLHLNADIGYSQNIDSSLELPGISRDRDNMASVPQRDYDLLSSNYLLANISSRFDNLLSKKNITIYLQLDWSYKNYDNIYSNLFKISTGVFF